jgi:hypothetical protein
MQKMTGRKRLRDADIEDVLRRNPGAQYQEMLNALHAAGFRVNRQGSWEILSRYERARKKIGAR